MEAGGVGSVGCSGIGTMYLPVRIAIEGGPGKWPVKVYRVRMKLDAQQHLERLNLYGMVQGLRYVVRLNDLKTAQHLRARLARVLRRPDNLAKPLRGDLKELFEISGLWVRNAGNRHDSKLQIRRLIRRIVPRVKTQSWRNRGPIRRQAID